jgi:outer membrane protein TolC
LYDFGRIKANVEKAKTDLKYAQHNVDYAKSQLANEVAVIYYNIIILKKALQLKTVPLPTSMKIKGSLKAN